MSVDEAARHRLFNRATEVLGSEEAEILMAHLPPGGWPNLATKQDVLAIRQELMQDVDSLREDMKRELSTLEQHLKAYTLRTILGANLGMAAAFGAIAFTAAGVGS